MDKAIYFSDIKELQHFRSSALQAEGYSYLYFGVEFCEWLIPTPEEVHEAMSIAKEAGLKFTLVTPYVSDTGLDKLKKIIEAIPLSNQTEVVINDFGVLRLLQRHCLSGSLSHGQIYFPLLTLVMGRLLTRQKRGFGISSRTNGTPPDLVKHFKSSNVDVPIIASFLKGQMIQRVELDNLIQGIQLDLSNQNMVASLYVPYGYVTTTRYCPFSYEGGSWQSLDGKCRSKCVGQVAVLESGIISREIYLRGNTQFYKNEELASEEELKSMGIDRIVYEPEVPS